MDVVASRQIVYHDVWCGEGNAYGQIQGLPTFFDGNETLYDCALSLDTETAIHGGLICSGDKFITDRSELETIKGNFPEGLAVDMESAAIAQVCYLYKVPFISFRIISDTPGADKHFEQYQNFWGEMADRSFHVTETFLKLCQTNYNKRQEDYEENPKFYCRSYPSVTRYLCITQRYGRKRNRNNIRYPYEGAEP